MGGRLTRVRGAKGGGFGSRHRAKQLIVGAAAVLWLALIILTRSPMAGSLLLVPLLGFVSVCIVALRALGVRHDHPLVRSMAARPWRDGVDVFRSATRRLPDVFIITPMGARIAPSAVDIRLNPDNLDSLAETLDPDLASELATEAYEAAIAQFHARLIGGRADVSVVADESVPPGRYVLGQVQRTGNPARIGTASLTGVARLSASGSRRGLGAPPTAIVEQPTVAISDHNPLLRLVTGRLVAETRTSGARAGRSRSVELSLPDEPTISRVHARFDYVNGQWHITGLGRNGLSVNGAPLGGTAPIRDGDLIRWGGQSDSLASRVEIS